MQNSFSFNKLLAAGMVTALILLGIAAIYAVRVIELRTGHDAIKSDSNPLIYGKNETEPIDNGVPQIPGIRVYSAQNDADQILIDTHQKEIEFQKNTDAKFADKNHRKYMQQMNLKNTFAAERLLFLQKIEAAETKEERLKLIEELRIRCEEKSKPNEKKE